MGISSNNLPEIEAAEAVIYYRPMVIANNVVLNNLVDLIHSGRPQKLKLAPGKYVDVTLMSEPDPKFSEFDLAVLSCLNAIWQDKTNPSNKFTLTLLCRMLGYTSKGGLSETAKHAVSESLSRLRNTTIQIRPEMDFEPHRKDFVARNDPSASPMASWDALTGVQWAAPNPLINIESSIRRIDRKDDQITEITRTLTQEPLLHLYSRVNGQFVTLDPRFMHPVSLDDDGSLTDASIAMTSTRIGMAFWCARQIVRTQYAAEHPPRGRKKAKPVSTGTLKLSRIFDRVGLDKRDASKHKGRHVDFLSDLFSSWAAQGLIPAWSMRKGMFRSCDALIVDFSSVCMPVSDQPTHAPETARAMESGTSPAPKIDATIGAVDTIIGALHAIIGAFSESARSVQTRVQSHFRSVLSELEELRNYCKYLSKHPPAAPGGAGGA